MAEVSGRGVGFVAAWEGFIECARDIGDGVLTIGHGTTSGTGRTIRRGDCISREKAARWLREDLNRKYLSKVPRRKRMKQRELDALASLAYNNGPGIVSDPGFSTLARRLRLRRARFYWYRKRAYRDEFPKWISPGTQFEEGLRRRRQAELRVAIHGDYSGRP